eukprot:scaffold4425_cov168-Amphora_coffeaeformis.AAC.9
MLGLVMKSHLILNLNGRFFWVTSVTQSSPIVSTAQYGTCANGITVPDGSVLQDYDNEDLEYEFRSKEPKLLERLLEEFDDQSQVADFGSYINGQVQGWFKTLESYFPIEWTEGLSGISYGGRRLPDSRMIGYIGFYTFGPQYFEEFVQDARGAFAFFQEKADAVVVDVRLNTGGDDTVAVLSPSFFAANKTLAYTLQANDGQGGLVEPLIDVFMDPEAFGTDDLLFLDKPDIL